MLETHRRREDDQREDAFLEACGAVYGRHRLRVAFTAGLGSYAKQAQDWKRTLVLADERHGAAIFKGRLRTRNGVIPAKVNGLVLVEFDGPRGELEAKYGIALPPSLAVVSRRGEHVYMRAPDGCQPGKFEIAESGISWSGDGVLISAGSLHESGHVYTFVNPNAPLLEPGQELYEELRRLARQSGKSGAACRRPRGEPIRSPGRRDYIFSISVPPARQGLDVEEILPMALAANEGFDPPLDVEEVRGQVEGAVHWAGKQEENDTAAETAATFLEEILRGTTAPTPAPTVTAKESPRRRELRRRVTSSIEARAVEWLIPNVVPLGTLSLVAGVGGLGKSALVLAWAAEVTREGKNVLVVSYEDAAEQVIRPRFEALNGDLDRLYELSIDPLEGSISFPTDLDELTRHARETDARLIVVDPVSASIDLKLDSHKDAHVRVVLGQLAKLADQLGLAVVMIAHLNKAPSGDVYLRVNGSTAFYNASRSVLTVTRDPVEELHRLIAHHKSNYGLVAAVERWALEVVEVPSATGPLQVARLVFLEVADDVSRDDVLAAHVPAKRSEAEALIVAQLIEGRRLSSDVKAAGVQGGDLAGHHQARGREPRGRRRGGDDRLRACHVLGAPGGPGGSAHAPSHTF